METIKRRPTRQIKLGNVLIGGGAPISVQSMLSVPTSDIPAALNQIHYLEKVGCEIIRFSVETMSDIPSIY